MAKLLRIIGLRMVFYRCVQFIFGIVRHRTSPDIPPFGAFFALRILPVAARLCPVHSYLLALRIFRPRKPVCRGICAQPFNRALQR